MSLDGTCPANAPAWIPGGTRTCRAVPDPVKTGDSSRLRLVDHTLDPRTRLPDVLAGSSPAVRCLVDMPCSILAQACVSRSQSLRSSSTAGRNTGVVLHEITKTASDQPAMYSMGNYIVEQARHCSICCPSDMNGVRVQARCAVFSRDQRGLLCGLLLYAWTALVAARRASYGAQASMQMDA